MCLCLSVRISSSHPSIRLHCNTLSQLLTLYKSPALCAYIDAEYGSLDVLCSTSITSGTFSDSRPTGVARIMFTTWGAASTNALPVRRIGIFVFFIAHLFGAQGYVGSLNFWPSFLESIGTAITRDLDFHFPGETFASPAGATNFVWSDEPTPQIHTSDLGESSRLPWRPLLFQHPDSIPATITPSIRPNPGDPVALPDPTVPRLLSATLIQHGAGHRRAMRRIKVILVKSHLPVYP